MKREADPITIDHIIALRKEILSLEKRIEKQNQYIEHTLNHAVELWTENTKLKGQINDLTGSNNPAAETNNAVSREDR